MHDAGYSVLAYDLRSHGESGEGDPPVTGVGFFEWQEVLASIDYIRDREDTSDSDVSLMSMCMGANATFNAMERAPEAFEHIKSLIAIAPLKGRTTIERNCEQMQIPIDEGVEVFEPIYTEITGLHIADHDVVPKAASARVPIFYLQVRDDMNSRWTDVQEMYDRTPGDDKKILFVEDTPWRFHGYTYFSEHPEEMVEWFDSHS